MKRTLQKEKRGNEHFKKKNMKQTLQKEPHANEHFDKIDMETNKILNDLHICTKQYWCTNDCKSTLSFVGECSVFKSVN